MWKKEIDFSKKKGCSGGVYQGLIPGQSILHRG